MKRNNPSFREWTHRLGNKASRQAWLISGAACAAIFIGAWNVSAQQAGPGPNGQFGENRPDVKVAPMPLCANGEKAQNLDGQLLCPATLGSSGAPTCPDGNVINRDRGGVPQAYCLLSAYKDPASQTPAGQINSEAKQDNGFVSNFQPPQMTQDELEATQKVLKSAHCPDNQTLVWTTGESAFTCKPNASSSPVPNPDGAGPGPNGKFGEDRPVVQAPSVPKCADGGNAGLLNGEWACPPTLGSGNAVSCAGGAKPRDLGTGNIPRFFCPPKGVSATAFQEPQGVEPSGHAHGGGFGGGGGHAEGGFGHGGGFGESHGSGVSHASHGTGESHVSRSAEPIAHGESNVPAEHHHESSTHAGSSSGSKESGGKTVYNDKGQVVKQPSKTADHSAVANEKKYAATTTKPYHRPSRPASAKAPDESGRGKRSPKDKSAADSSKATNVSQKNKSIRNSKVVNNTKVDKRVTVNKSKTTIINKTVYIHNGGGYWGYGGYGWYSRYDWYFPNYFFWDYYYPAAYLEWGLNPWGYPAIWYFDELHDYDWYYAYPHRYASNECEGAYQRIVRTNYPRNGDYLCVDVPTEPAIWVPNPNNDPYMPYIGVTQCPDGLIPMPSTFAGVGRGSLDLMCSVAPTESAAPAVEGGGEAAPVESATGPLNACTIEHQDNFGGGVDCYDAAEPVHHLVCHVDHNGPLNTWNADGSDCNGAVQRAKDLLR